MAGSPQAKDKEALSSLPGPTYGYLYSKMNLKRSAFLNSVSPSSKLLNLRGSWEPRVHRHKLGQKYRPEKCGWPADPKVPLVCEVRTGLWRPELSPCVSGAVAKWLASALGCGAPSLGGNRCNLYFHS